MTAATTGEYGWHQWITEAGAQAAAIMAIIVLAGFLVRGAVRMRRSTKTAFAEAVGTQVAIAMSPLAERIAAHENAESTQMGRLEHRMDLLATRVDTFINATTALHQELRAHMSREEESRS